MDMGWKGPYYPVKSQSWEDDVYKNKGKNYG